MEYKDLANKEIKVGDFIIYSALCCRSSVLKYGRVVELGIRKDTYDEKNLGWPTLKVISADRMNYWNREKEEDESKWEIQANGRIITLGFVNRCLVIPIECVPVEVQNLLK